MTAIPAWAAAAAAAAPRIPAYAAGPLVAIFAEAHAKRDAGGSDNGSRLRRSRAVIRAALEDR